MKILQLTPRMPWPLNDGGAIGIFNITKSLAELGHRITLVTYPHVDRAMTEEGVRDLSKYAEVELVSKPLPSRNSVLMGTMFRGAYPIERRMMPEMFELLRRILGQKQFDVVHVDHAHMGKYGLWIKKNYGLPIVLREHNFEALIYERFARTEPNPAKRFVARMHGKRLRKEEVGFLHAFDAIAAITEEDAAIMRNVAPKARIKVIPAGVNTDYFRPSAEKVDPDHILWIGSIVWDPNYDAVRYFLSSIFPSILLKRPQTRLDIIGIDSERIRPLAAEFGESVRVLGFVPDIRDFLANSAVLVVPLRIGGGMRLKLLDFFASGKAVVTTTIGAEGNLAKDGIHALIRDTEEGFAEAVLQLLADPELRKMLGTNARELVLQHYSWRTIAQDFTRLYESVMAKKSVRPVLSP